jgi:hypothetical protein
MWGNVSGDPNMWWRCGQRELRRRRASRRSSRSSKDMGHGERAAVSMGISA